MKLKSLPLLKEFAFLVAKMSPIQTWLIWVFKPHSFSQAITAMLLLYGSWTTWISIYHSTTTLDKMLILLEKQPLHVVAKLAIVFKHVFSDILGWIGVQIDPNMFARLQGFKVSNVNFIENKHVHVFLGKSDLFCFICQCAPDPAGWSIAWRFRPCGSP